MQALMIFIPLSASACALLTRKEPFYETRTEPWIGCSGIKTEDINIVREFLDRWSRDGNMSELDRSLRFGAVRVTSVLPQ
jgi:hypothetical protein